MVRVGSHIEVAQSLPVELSRGVVGVAGFSLLARGDAVSGRGGGVAAVAPRVLWCANAAMSPG